MGAVDEKFPIGKFKVAEKVTDELLERWIDDIKELPVRLREAVEGLTEEQLNTPYREGGWTVRQVVNHVTDSHMNAYVRFRLALTEDIPTIKPYVQTAWGELVDAKSGSIKPSLLILEGLHERWEQLLSSLSHAEFSRTFFHPELKIKLDLYKSTALYSWHCRHHVAHIMNLRQKNNW